MDWLKIGSIVLNVVLAVALFFKGPLNELAKRVGLGWLDRRDRQKALLRQLYAEVGDFAAAHALVLMVARLAWRPETKHLVTSANEDLVKSSLDGYAKAYTFLQGNFLEFPPLIRALLKELHSVVWFTPNIGPDGYMRLDPIEVKATMAEVLRVTTAIREALERDV